MDNTPDTLTEAQCRDIVREIRNILWTDVDEKPNPNREWDSETIEHVASTLAGYGLRPSLQR